MSSILYGAVKNNNVCLRIVCKMNIFIAMSLLVPALTLDPKSVNIDVETSVLFEPKDAKNNASILNSVKRFLDDLQQVLDPKPQTIAQHRARPDTPKFTEVLDDLGKALVNFSDDEIMDLTKNIYGKVKKIKITNDDGFISRNFKHTVKNLLKGWSKTEPDEIRRSIKSYLGNDRGFFMDYMMEKLNYLFEESEVERIKSKLDKITRSKNLKDLNKIADKIINYLVNYNNKVSGNLENEEIITAGRLKIPNDDSGKEKEEVVRLEFKTKPELKENSKEVIMNKNIEVYVRAAP